MTKRRPAGTSRGAPRRSVDRDGVVRVELRRGGLPVVPVAIGLAAACILAFLAWKWRDALPADTGAGSHRGEPGQTRATPQVRAPARSKGAPTLRLAARLSEASEASEDPEAVAPSNARDVIGAEGPDEDPEVGPDEPADEHAAEGAPRGKTGIHAFPAPGTKRLKPGLVVPDDFPLPQGYMRHYQATDKGRMLEPILLYHPDYELVDAEGHVIPLPPDRVVPPDMAPEGLPMDTLEIPADAYADRDERGPPTNVEPGQTGVEEEESPADVEP